MSVECLVQMCEVFGLVLIQNWLFLIEDVLAIETVNTIHFMAEFLT